jgi:nucleoside-triphosphatase
MAVKQVILLTGPIQTGKTTALLNWLKNRTDAAGILTPVENGQRYFLTFPGAVSFHMEATAADTAVLEVGRFRFSAVNFERAASLLTEQLLQPEWNYIVVDEIGPLELNGRNGFWAVLNKILAGNHTAIPVLVVREKCCDALYQLLTENGFKEPSSFNAL